MEKGTDIKRQGSTVFLKIKRNLTVQSTIQVKNRKLIYALYQYLISMFEKKINLEPILISFLFLGFTSFLVLWYFGSKQ